MNKSESKYFNTALRFDKALLSLLEKKPFEYITVSEICKEAGVNRSTFYLHYENTCDLLEESLRYVLELFRSYFPKEQHLSETQIRNRSLGELVYVDDKYLHPYLIFVKEHRQIFLAALSQPGIFCADQIFDRLFEGVFDPILERFAYPGAERKYVMMFYLNGLTAIVVQWLRDDCDKSIEQLTEIIRSCVFGRNVEV